MERGAPNVFTICAQALRCTRAGYAPKTAQSGGRVGTTEALPSHHPQPLRKMPADRFCVYFSMIDK